MVYALHPEERDAMCASVVARAMTIEGVDLIAWLARDAHDAPSEGVLCSPARGELRFAPAAGGAHDGGARGGEGRGGVGRGGEGRGGVGRSAGGELRDARGRDWRFEGTLAALDARVDDDGVLSAPSYPDALARVWSALTCPTAGEVLLSAAPGYEFLDWGGAAHVGGGSHGSLHVSDSLAPLVLCGIDPQAAPSVGAASAGPDAQWSIADVAPLVRRHFAS